MKKSYTYDLMISFAEEDRSVAAGIKDCLSFLKANCYYYPDHLGENWAKNLGASLEELYQYESQMGLVILSETYLQKTYTMKEFNALNRRRANSQRDFLLLLKVGNVPVEGLKGLPEDFTYVEWAFNPRSIAEMIIEKLVEQGWQPKQGRTEAPATGAKNIQIGGGVSGGRDVNIG